MRSRPAGTASDAPAERAVETGVIGRRTVRIMWSVPAGLDVLASSGGPANRATNNYCDHVTSTTKDVAQWAQTAAQPLRFPHPLRQTRRPTMAVRLLDYL